MALDPFRSFRVGNFTPDRDLLRSIYIALPDQFTISHVYRLFEANCPDGDPWRLSQQFCQNLRKEGLIRHDRSSIQWAKVEDPA